MVGFPKGLTYIEDYLTEEQQRKLLFELDALPWSNELKRRVQHYGYKYDYTKRSIDPTMKVGPIPYVCDKLAKKLVEDQLMPSKPDQLIVNEYMPGQGIAQHIDCVPCFRDVIISVSLLATYQMNFSLGKDRMDLDLKPGSLLLLEDEARFVWKHGIIPRLSDGERLRERRISLTFRRVILNG